MNQLLKSIALVALTSFYCTSCKTKQVQYDEQGNEIVAKKKAKKVYKSLREALEAKGGLNITGTGANTQVFIRSSSFSGNVEPVYYVNGADVGNSYASAVSAIGTKTIKSARVISSLSQLAVYGEAGKNGIIKIKTIK